ncbi:poly polymerase catalytic domain-containing protein [Dactylonectria macrodidyma]|uniref:Poly [ADP-ribose] polymerase n=1 Tax=Dactylonectria macrodidyma TaxID=307937 RepID=A0A9P9IAU6_9HYPO|nr:poly polymerase catalytic domain-containing protein [Dactylonectria macrodidyma]
MVWSPWPPCVTRRLQAMALSPLARAVALQGFSEQRCDSPTGISRHPHPIVPYSFESTNLSSNVTAPWTVRLAMDNWWCPDPPGTINPAKLTSCPPTASEALTAHEAAHQRVPSTAPTTTISRSIAPPLPRISSDWDPDHDIVVRGNLGHQDIRKEFEDSHVAKRRPAGARARRTSHHGYFRRQTDGRASLRVPVDLGARADATVLIDRATASIYDVYLLRVDISKNENFFRRHQIVFNTEAKTYTLLTREGRVGLQGVGKQEMEETDLKPVVARFRKIFRNNTGLAWNRRYESPFIPSWHFMFVELDYRGTVACPKEVPNYAMIDARITEEVRDLMELMLYGGSMRKHNGGESPSTSRPWPPFSAPYEQVSPWSIFLAFKILERIWKYLESVRPIHWKAILRASSLYRSRIPFCAGHDRPPVISSYHAIFLELKFLHSLHPRQEIANMLAEVHRRGSLQLNAHKALAQPLYQAYSSLRHGFRRLTDASTLEFRELKYYLENSCHHTHYRILELQDIYRVFVKANLPNPYCDWIKAKQGHDACGEERLLLWHGTPLDSLLGILDLGLQIRRQGASFTGTMFGNGIYLADVSSKSAGYCKHELWGGEAVILLCEADIGARRIRSLTSISDGHEAIEKSDGQQRCIEGVGRVRPSKWKKVGWEMGGLPFTGDEMVLMPDTAVPYSDTFSEGSLAFHEYVVYNPSHVLIRYLFRVKVKNT